jgi:hypothetical protein
MAEALEQSRDPESLPALGENGDEEAIHLETIRLRVGDRRLVHPHADRSLDIWLVRLCERATGTPATRGTKRDKSSGEFMAVKKPAKKKKAAKKFKGVRREKAGKK